MTRSPGSPRARRERVALLDPDDPTEVFELRDALVCDADASVRARAILRLTAGASSRLLVYLRDATQDRAMTVREAAFVALGRARDASSLALAEHACRFDRSFRVRRAAAQFAARTGHPHAAGVVRIAGEDPFWRVRALASRLDPASAPAGRDPAGKVIELPGIDADPDPAVVTARLLGARPRVDPDGLVPALGHPHRSLRRFAIREISRRGTWQTLLRTTRWLDDERVPYGPAAAEATLNRAGERAERAARELLAAPSGHSPGALAWALAAVHEPPAWSGLEAWLQHPDFRLRRAAVERLVEAAPTRDSLLTAMKQTLLDSDAEVQLRAALWLAQTRSRAALDALLQLEAREQPTALRALLVELGMAYGLVERLEKSADDPHAGIRAAALGELSRSGKLSADQKATLFLDPDPWLRAAVIDPANASRALADPAEHVRHRALDHLGPEPQATWARTAGVEDPDPALRARAAAALTVDASDAATEAVLRLSRNEDFGTRSIAVECLAARRADIRRLLESGTLCRSAAFAAYSGLRLAGEDVALPADDDGWRAHAKLLECALSNEAPEVMQPIQPERPPLAPTGFEVQGRRRLGQSELVVHPFGLSGAYEPSYSDLAQARERGVDLFFWEPTHRELSRFLQSRSGRDAVVVAGTYEADPGLIERDVDRALSALRRDHIDVFLAFWTRSVARLDHVGGIFERLIDAGRIRVAGISTHDRALARTAAERGFGVVMVRHNAAHRGAEVDVFPSCEDHGTGVLTFSNLCYGRMLLESGVPGSAPISAADCYRYSLSQPGVHACISAPRRHSEVLENLAVVDQPTLGAARLRELRAHGDAVYRRFRGHRAETWPDIEHPSSVPFAASSGTPGSSSVLASLRPSRVAP